MFECLLALQVWALSTILTSPGVFMCSSLYVNFDFLLWRAKEVGAIDEQMSVFSWILWNLKVRNDKVFDGKDKLPLETLQLAIHEAKDWLLAQTVHPSEEDQMVEKKSSSLAVTEVKGQARCPFDGYWHQESISGAGWILTTEHSVILFG